MLAFPIFSLSSYPPTPPPSITSRTFSSRSLHIRFCLSNSLRSRHLSLSRTPPDPISTPPPQQPLRHSASKNNLVGNSSRFAPLFSNSLFCRTAAAADAAANIPKVISELLKSPQTIVFLFAAFSTRMQLYRCVYIYSPPGLYIDIVNISDELFRASKKGAGSLY